MFKGSGTWRYHVRRLHRTATGSHTRLGPGLLASTALVASVLWYSHHVVHNDAPLPFAPVKKQVDWYPNGPSEQNKKGDTLTALVWGSNRCAACCHFFRRAISFRQQSQPSLVPASQFSYTQETLCSGMAEQCGAPGFGASRKPRRLCRCSRGCLSVGRGVC